MARSRAVLVSTSEDTSELEELLYSLGYDVAHHVLQRRARPDPATYLGRGKVDELRAWLAAQGVRVPARRRGAEEALLRAERAGTEERQGARADGREAGDGDGSGPDRKGPGSEAATPLGPVRLVAVNDRLKPSQIAALERMLGVDVYDRVRVILEIFQQRAHTKEAKLQVELARLRYERPLVREYIHLAKRGEHPGYMAGGAYAVDQYYNTINGRISRIRDELGRITREREVRRKHRRRGGFFLVSLAGYANAGKSSLLRALSGEDVLVENRMFSTLHTRTGRARAAGRDVLVTDTVGFVSGLPPDLVEAFRSTLEEIAHADVIVLVCDASDAPAEMVRKLETSLRVLGEYDDLAPVVLALNKADAVSPAHRASVEAALDGLPLPQVVARTWISALRGEGLEALAATVLGQVAPLRRVHARLPADDTAGRLLAAIYEEAGADATRPGPGLEVEFFAPEAVAGRLARRIREAGGEASLVLDPSPTSAA